MRLPPASVQLMLLLGTAGAAISTDTLGWIARWALIAYAAIIAISCIVPPYHSRVEVLQPAPSSFVLLTGCSSGLGLASTHLFAARGWNMVLLGRDASKLEALRSELAARHPRQLFETLVQDLAVPDADRLVVRRLRQMGFRVDAEGEGEGDQSASDSSVAQPPATKFVDVLVNNAGFGLVSLFLSSPLGPLQRMVNCHNGAVVGLSHALLPAMLSRGRGRLANVSSMVGVLPSPRAAVYAATKAFLTSFTHSIAYEVALRVDALAAESRRAGTGAPNVAVVLVAPGATRTQFAATAEAESSLIFRLPLLSQSCDDAARQMVDGILEGRPDVQPGLLTRLVAFVAPKFPSKFAHFVVFFLWGSGNIAADLRAAAQAAAPLDKRKTQ